MEPTSAVAAEYILSRDMHAMARLNYQHYLLTEEYGYLLHPSIDATRENLKIADIGTGTCIWAIQVSGKISPNSTIDAIDISLELCPPQEWLPQNVRLLTHDVFKPFPEEMIGTYDVVNVRLLICVIKDNRPDAVIANLKTLLKPNGYLQWHECDIDETHLEMTPSYQSSTAESQKMVSFMKKPRQHSNFNWAPRLGDEFRTQGFSDVVFTSQPTSEKHRMAWNLNIVMLCEEYSARLARDTSSASNPEIAAQLSDAIKKASVELKNGVAICSALIAAIGRKT